VIVGVIYAAILIGVAYFAFHKLRQRASPGSRRR